MSRLWLVALLGAGCAGTMHPRGDRDVSVYAHGAFTVGTVADFRGQGRAESGGASVAGHWYLRDGLALTAALTPLLVYDQADGAVFTGEIQAGPRVHLWEKGKFGVFMDVLGGFAFSTSRIPPAGTPYNVTFAAGPGVEYALDDSKRLLGGVRFRHFSNARGQVASNPSQNEIRIWLGLSFDW